ncbi:hypothetical protein [Microcoleus sp. FACHB-831]|nr:hypothetical protein [Microcoleus sp. FACHB-831]
MDIAYRQVKYGTPYLRHLNLSDRTIPSLSDRFLAPAENVRSPLP